MPTIEQTTTPIADTFRRNVESVYRLNQFDRVVLDFSIQQVSTLAARLENAGYNKNHPVVGAENTLTALRNIRENDSLRKQYGEMFNQSLVLLVSYFGLSIRDLFKECLVFALQNGRLETLGRHELTLTIGDLQSGEDNLTERIASLFVAEKDISFQDMQSIGRAFGDFLGCQPVKDKDVNNIILAQACRHAIVHSGAITDDRLIRQVSGATPRDVKLSLTLEEKLQFSPTEIQTIGASMVQYLESVTQKLNEKFSS